MIKFRTTFLKSVFYALRGIYISIKYERNMKIHVTSAILIIITGAFLRISKIEWVFISFAISLVLFAELINTAIEVNVDIAVEEKKYTALKAKDIAAGAVLITAINAFVVGSIIFIPRILQIIK